MNKLFRVADYDIIYLSYDEPNAEKNYADLCKKVPWAKRVHGVKGSDSAHKACARLSETDYFITVDGDNIINEDFINLEHYFDQNENLDNCVISWAAENQINGLIYGNGGIKCWPKNHVLGMRTHENADPNNLQAQIEFCWDTRYIQMEGCFSKIMNNGSPKQAWRAGFREGVKMALNQGAKPTINEFKQNHWKNLHRLYIWLMVGTDVENGIWAIYGAREGLYKTMCTNWDYINVRDFDWLNDYWENTVTKKVDEENIIRKCEDLADALIPVLNLPISAYPLEADQSKFFKTVYQNPARLSNTLMQREK